MEGHNSGDKKLQQLVDRIERLEEDKKGIADDIKDIYAGAKADGYDTTTIRELVRLRKLDPQVVRERRMLLDTYFAAFGVEL